MNLDIIDYHSLLTSHTPIKQLELALFNQGIVGISHVPNFEKISRDYVLAARKFAALPEISKQKYAPNRDAGITEGYELGAEKFQDSLGNWNIDDKKASYYAYVPDHSHNVWPQEVDLKSSYLALGQLIFETGKILLKAIGLNESIGLDHTGLLGYGRMLHYQKNTLINNNPNWCGAHYDHGLFTGLMPAYYFHNDQEIDEPEEAGLHILPPTQQYFSKIHADKSILLFQVGEFAQLITHDRIKATKHLVKTSNQSIERFAFALFFNAAENATFKSTSQLALDERYINNKTIDDSINYKTWADASYFRYWAK